MHPGIIAAREPDKTAYVMAETGQRVSYGELERTANQGAHLFRSLGLERGDHIAILLENHPRFFQICWAAQRAGLYYTAISYRLQQGEVEYIVNNCEARVFITSAGRSAVVEALVGRMPRVERCFMVDGTAPGFESWEDAIAAMPESPIADQAEGQPMLYSSGTTGYPKGVKKPLPEEPYGELTTPNLLGLLYGADEHSIYLSPAPLYHAAPLGFTMGCLRYGTQVVVMEHFDAERALEFIERYRVTHSQWVPTMFTRMLALPVEERSSFDLSSQKVAIHAAAPCPAGIKRQMLEWWGPIIHEFYGGSEQNGLTHCTPEEWLERPGTVGKPVLGTIHICDDDGLEVPTGETGLVYFELPNLPFEYHQDEAKTKSAQHPEHENWSALGDIGYVDDAGFLYLTDRATFMIISGGVNIYPQEIEDQLIMHPKVLDVAVVGVPDDQMGEAVKAVVQTVPGISAGPGLEAELLNYAREHLAHYKCPRSVDFLEELPRLPTGKLYKRLIKDRYWGNSNSRIV
jgi:acyl-CoA synthetase (AMP-forming)/AMP-acid ligase II